MPNLSAIKPHNVHCEGGLVMDESIDVVANGAAFVLQNFEPDIEGGYKRLLGYEEFDSTALTGTGNVLGIGFRGAQTVACRGPNVEYSIGSGWTSIYTGKNASTGRYKFDTYRLGGALTIAMADDSGLNPASKWNGTTHVVLNGTGAPSAPHDVLLFQDHLFLVQGNVVTFSAPFDDTDYTPANGAGSFIIPSDTGTIIKLKVRRNRLYVFCPNSIFVINGTSVDDFQLDEVSLNVGCVDAWSIQEFAGDISFLAPDGIRSIKGTDSSDDTIAISTNSTAIQPLIKGLSQETTTGSSCIVRNKSQYRYWYNASNTDVGDALGIIATLKNRSAKNTVTGASQTAWEYSQIVGIKPTCAASTLLSDTGAELVLHGEADGKVYKQENTKTFNTRTIVARYRTPDIIIEDKGMNKRFHRIIVNFDDLGSATMTMSVVYDIGSVTTPQPDDYTIVVAGSTSVYGTAVYDTATYTVDAVVEIRQSIEGSGMIIALDFNERAESSPFSIKGFQLEFEELARY